MIGEKIKVDLISAQRQRDARLLGILRLLISALDYKKIEARVDKLAVEVEVAVLRSEAKKRREAGDIFEKAGDLVRKAQEDFELKIIESYLPVLMAEDEVEKIVKELAAETGKAGGELIGLVMAKLKGKVDGSVVAKLVAKT